MAGAAVWMLLLLVPRPYVRVGAGGAYAVAVAFWWAVLISAYWPQGGDNLVPSPSAVARFVADTVAGHHTGHERPGPVAAATRRSLAELLKPYLRDAPEPGSPGPASS